MYTVVNFVSNKQKSTYRVLDRNVEISLAKAAKSDFWPRVTYKKEKAAWLRLDFDKLELEDSEGDQEQVQKVNILKQGYLTP